MTTVTLSDISSNIPVRRVGLSAFSYGKAVALACVPAWHAAGFPIEDIMQEARRTNPYKSSEKRTHFECAFHTYLVEVLQLNYASPLLVEDQGYRSDNEEQLMYEAGKTFAQQMYDLLVRMESLDRYSAIYEEASRTLPNAIGNRWLLNSVFSRGVYYMMCELEECFNYPDPLIVEDQGYRQPYGVGDRHPDITAAYEAGECFGRVCKAQGVLEEDAEGAIRTSSHFIAFNEIQKACFLNALGLAYSRPSDGTDKFPEKVLCKECDAVLFDDEVSHMCEACEEACEETKECIHKADVLDARVCADCGGPFESTEMSEFCVCHAEVHPNCYEYNLQLCAQCAKECEMNTATTALSEGSTYYLYFPSSYKDLIEIWTLDEFIGTSNEDLPYGNWEDVKVGKGHHYATLDDLQNEIRQRNYEILA